MHERHASTELQNAFYEALLAYDDWKLSEPEPTVRFEDKDVPISSIFGRMRTSDDLLPEKVRLTYLSLADNIDDDAKPGETTFAAVAVQMRELCLERLRQGRENDSDAS